MKRQRRNDVLIKAIAEKLVQLREDRGLSQQIVYIDTELHMGRIERGEYNITLSTLAELCACLLYTSPSPRDRQKSRMPSSA